MEGWTRSGRGGVWRVVALLHLACGDARFAPQPYAVAALRHRFPEKPNNLKTKITQKTYLNLHKHRRTKDSAVGGNGGNFNRNRRSVPVTIVFGA